MSDDALAKALAAAAEASQDSKQLELMKTVLVAQAITAAIQPHQCQHHDEKTQQPFDAGSGGPSAAWPVSADALHAS